MPIGESYFWGLSGTNCFYSGGLYGLLKIRGLAPTEVKTSPE